MAVCYTENEMDVFWPKNPSRLRKIIYLIVGTGFILFLLNFRISMGLAAGCTSSGNRYIGGCLGKQAIPFQISWSMRRCLKISVNTCNRPDIQLHSTCGEQITLSDKIYESDERYIYLDQTGKSGVIFTSGNVGGKPFYILSYVAAPGCH